MILARKSRGCREETSPVEFQLTNVDPVRHRESFCMQSVGEEAHWARRATSAFGHSPSKHHLRYLVLLVMTHFLPPLDITPNTFCTNFSHHPNIPLIIFFPVAMASPFLLYPRVHAQKLSAPYAIQRYINLKTYVIHWAHSMGP